MRRRGRWSGWALWCGAVGLGGCASGAAADAPPSVERAGGSALALRVEGGAVTLAAPEGASVTLQTEGLTAGAVESLDAGRTLVLHRAGVDERWEARDGQAEQSWTFAQAPAGELTVRVRVTGLRYAATDGVGLRLVDARTGAPWRYSHATWVDARGTRTAVPAAWDDGAVVMRVPADVAARSAYPAVLDPTVGPETLVDGVVRTAVLDTRTDFPSTAAFVGSSYAIAMQGARLANGFQSILLSRARPDGTIPDPGATWIDHYTDDVPREGLFPSIVSDGAGGALVLWIYQGLWAARLAADGTLGTPTLVEGNGYFLPYAPSRYYYDLFPDAGQFVGVIAMPGHEPTPYAVRRHRPDGTYAADAPLVTLGSAFGPIFRPKIAATASGYLVAWQTAEVATGSDVRFARVSRAGAMLDPAGAPLTVAAVDRHDVHLASDGAHWLATWTADTGSGSRAPGVYWVLLGSDGAPVGAAVNYAGVGTASGAAFNGTNFLLAWRDGTTLNTARISPAGARLDATAARWDTLRPGDVNVSTNGTDFLVTANGGRLVARAVSAANVPLGALFTAGVYDVDDVNGTLCYDGAQYRATWARFDTLGAVHDLLTARVSLAGALLDATPRTFPLAADGLVLPTLGALCTGTTLQRDNLFATLGASGEVTAAHTVPSVFVPAGVEQRTSFGAAAAPYGSLTVGFVTADSNNKSVVAVRRGPDGATLDAFPIALDTVSNGALSYLKGGVAFDGVNHAAVWAASGSTGSPLRFGRVSPEGDVLDPGGRALAPPGFNASIFASVALTAGAAQHLLVWSTYANCAAPVGRCQQLRAMRLSTAGAPLDASAIALTDLVSATPGSYRVAWDGREYLVAWAEPTPNGQVRVARVSTAGTLLDPGGFAVTSTPGTKDTPLIASAGDGTAIVAYRQYVPALGAMRFVTRTIDPGGAVVDAGVDAGASTDVPRDVGSTSDLGVTVPIDVPALDAGADVGAVDAGTPPIDVPATDVGAPPIDVALSDAGTPPSDVSATDAGSPSSDVSATDASSPSTDVSATDASSPSTDVSATDVGSPTRDAGSLTRDAGADRSDVSAAADAGPTDAGGASCSASPRAPSSGGAPLALGALVAVLARRRRRVG